MNERIQSGVSIFYELGFSTEPGIGIVVLRVIGFTNIIIVRFDPTIVEVKDIAMGVIHVGFFMTAAL
jgi:predicted membrane-bound dolichyl-phosphate-mannose-protein mannosyltransferase